MRLAGIEIGGTKLQIVCGDETGRIHERVSLKIDPVQGAPAIQKNIEEALSGFGPLDGVGVGFGGPVNRITGEIWTSYHVEGWTNFNLKNWLSWITRAEVFVDNDANVAALGEAVAGAGVSDGIVFYVTLGSGVGGGLTINKKIYHGELPGELEFGHIRIDKSGRTIQSSCAGWAVNEKIVTAINRNSTSILARLAMTCKGSESQALAGAMEAGDADALAIFGETVDDLAFGLSHVVHLIHPDVIVIGGGLSLMGEVLRSRLEATLPSYLMDAFRPGPRISLSKLGPDVVPVGALILAAH